MNIFKKTYLVLANMVLWVMTMSPPVYVLRECINSYINGTYHGFNGEEKIYGMEAFVDTFFFFIAFFFVVFIVWILLLLLSTTTTVITVRNWNKK
ncbi:hypothetical protein [Butyrivibrio sp. AC2005]|uniref:hypothetical protein n=1 Tax=Butyrivibrio sp. AC2005 TaxID=1280672 RepID=UPI00047CBE80|nr:hypothetical protein [Butyrivibrio sp. AC2005]